MVGASNPGYVDRYTVYISAQLRLCEGGRIFSWIKLRYGHPWGALRGSGAETNYSNSSRHTK